MGEKKFTKEAIDRAEQFVRGIYPTLDDLAVKAVAAKVLVAMPKFVFDTPVQRRPASTPDLHGEGG